MHIAILEDNDVALEALRSTLAEHSTHMVRIDVIKELPDDKESRAACQHILASANLIVCDRDTSDGSSFHGILPECCWGKVISTSSEPLWNRVAKMRGCRCIVEKDFGDLKGWSLKVVVEVLKVLQQRRRTKHQYRSLQETSHEKGFTL